MKDRAVLRGRPIPAIQRRPDAAAQLHQAGHSNLCAACFWKSNAGARTNRSFTPICLMLVRCNLVRETALAGTRFYDL